MGEKLEEGQTGEKEIRQARKVHTLVGQVA